jgi:hypothetical protein
MTLGLAVVLFLALLAAWAMAWRNNPALAIGIGIGILVSWAGVGLLGDLSVQTIPLWLPPLPFAVVAVTLIGFGALAWFWGTRADESRSPPGSAGPPHR